MSRYHTSSAPFARVIRALAEAWQSFEQYSGAHIRTTGLSAPQFDVICTLGNTEGMTFSELGHRTLIYKTTLTGVVDRLEQKGLVERVPCEQDRRCVYVRLTGEGEALFEEVFPAHMAHLGDRLDALSPEELETVEHSLRRLASALSGHAGDAESGERVIGNQGRG
ncbi:MarR family transcriptional regulator [Arhodomonas aquaeolei]|uniref:MarR family winged helix-turn-helix transcriptional regulator n=1 Tax=Arhodomonas aquaeolei TaxID=2369 RepID=UPI002169DE4B|nr:MarR family transcriptional regulator [Arhodomonas aquaeolei]MCS4504538.1 MarR family transcriptional regulator [Arhodomonas aquaeolei]